MITLIIPAAGFLLACGSLAWQTYAYRMSGPRVRVVMLIGAVVGGNLGAPPARRWLMSAAVPAPAGRI